LSFVSLMWLLRSIIGMPDVEGPDADLSSKSVVAGRRREVVPPLFAFRADDTTSIFATRRTGAAGIRPSMFDEARLASRQLFQILALCHAALGAAEDPRNLPFSDSIALDVFATLLPGLYMRASAGKRAPAGPAGGGHLSALQDQMSVVTAAASAAALLRRQGALPDTPPRTYDRAALEASVVAFSQAQLARIGASSVAHCTDAGAGAPAESWQSASSSASPGSAAGPEGGRSGDDDGDGDGSGDGDAGLSGGGGVVGGGSDGSRDWASASADPDTAASALRRRAATARAAALSEARTGLGLARGRGDGDRAPTLAAGSGVGPASGSASAPTHDALASELGDLSAALKERVRAIAGAMEVDKAVLTGVDDVTGKLEGDLSATTDRLWRFLSSSGWSCCGSLAMLAFAVVLLLLAIVVIKVVPKPKWGAY
jgi:hypothetical protein